MAAMASLQRPATDHSLVLGAERKLQAEGLRRVKAYRVERRPRDLVGRLRPPREGVDGGLRRRAPAGLAAAEDHGGLAGRRLRCPHLMAQTHERAIGGR